MTPDLKEKWSHMKVMVTHDSWSKSVGGFKKKSGRCQPQEVNHGTPEGRGEFLDDDDDDGDGVIDRDGGDFRSGGFQLCGYWTNSIGWGSFLI